MQHIRKTISVIALLSLTALITGCATGRSTFSKGEKLEAEGKLDEAIAKYAEAARENPDVGEYRAKFLTASEKSARNHLRKGEEFMDDDKLDEALREFQTAAGLDSSLDRARQLSEQAIKLRNSQLYFKEGEELEKNRKPREAFQSYKQAIIFNPDNEKAQEALDRLKKSQKSRLEGSELNLKSTKPITLKFKDAKTKDVFNIITQLSGINFVFDEAIKDTNITIYLENATFQQALDVITGMQKLGKKILNETTIILYPKTPDKQKQYEDLMVQTFYLNKLDAKKAINLIRTLLQVKKIYVNEEMNALVVRDVPEVIEVVGKILEANDLPDAEVVLEVEVIEVSKKNTEAVGLLLSQYAVSLNTLTPGGAFFADTLKSSITTADQKVSSVTASNLLQTFQWKGHSGYVTVPNATYNLGKTLANAETLASPKIRVKNREKAKFNVGQRVPITTTSSPSGGGVSVNVQYVDVGVKLNAEPIIQINNEVTMKLGLEVSSIINSEKLGGSDSLTTVVTIGTRNLDTVLSLKDGETSIIGGLIQDSKTNSKQKFYLIGDIPIIGPLLSNTSNEKTKTETLLAITPRIVRSISVPDSDVTSFWSGREDEPSVTRPFTSFAQEPEYALPGDVPTVGSSQKTVALPPAPATTTQPPTPQPPAQPQTIPAPQPTPATPPAAVPSATPAPLVQPSAPESKPTIPQSPPTVTPPAPALPIPVPQPTQVENPVPPVEQAPAAPQKPPRISVTLSAPQSVKVKEQFSIEIKASDVIGLHSAPFILVYDPIFVEFVGASEGDFLKLDGKATSFKATNDKNTGQVTFEIRRPVDAVGINGVGRLATAQFKARNLGPASFGLLGTNFSAPGGKHLDVLPYNAVVEVK